MRFRSKYGGEVIVLYNSTVTQPPNVTCDYDSQEHTDCNCGRHIHRHGLHF